MRSARSAAAAATLAVAPQPGIDLSPAFMPYPCADLASAPDGPLSGLRFAVSDLFDVAGYPTAAGNPVVLALSGIRTNTAPIVQALLDAGAHCEGKTLIDELAFSISGRNGHFGTPVNGAAPGRIPGGASSGAASAVSTGLCDFALGTDTGGSTRAPASHCGLYGLRPTQGRLPLAGCRPLCPSFDTAGLLARTGRVFERVCAALLGVDAHPLPSTPRPLFARDAFDSLDETVRQTLAVPCARLRACLGPARAVRVAADPDADSLLWAFRHLQGREAWTSNAGFLTRHAPPLGPGVAERFAWAREIGDEPLVQARRLQRAHRARMTGLLKTGAVLILPTMPDIAPHLDESAAALDNHRHRAMRLLCWASLAGLPQVTLPLARRLGAPLGLSLIGPAGSDLSLVRLGVRIAAGAGAP